jgi:hypothetical protein
LADWSSILPLSAPLSATARKAAVPATTVYLLITPHQSAINRTTMRQQETSLFISPRTHKKFNHFAAKCVINNY